MILVTAFLKNGLVEGKRVGDFGIYDLWFMIFTKERLYAFTKNQRNKTTQKQLYIFTKNQSHKTTQRQRYTPSTTITISPFGGWVV